MFPGTGCVIDGSHMSSIDFTTAVIDLAVDAGFEIDEEQYRQDIVDIIRHPERLDDDTEYEIMDALDWTYEDALDFLNNGLPNGLYYTVDDQCLILEELED